MDAENGAQMTKPVTRKELESLQRDVGKLADTVADLLEGKLVPGELPAEPTLYDDLTAEQWWRVVNEEFPVVVSDISARDANVRTASISEWTTLQRLDVKGTQHYFNAGANWKHCVVVRQPGHRQPNFGETPVFPDGTRLLVKHRSGDVFHLYASQIHHWDIRNEAEDIMGFVYYELTTGAK
jgi:hypothetical protein